MSKSEILSGVLLSSEDWTYSGSDSPCSCSSVGLCIGEGDLGVSGISVSLSLCSSSWIPVGISSWVVLGSSLLVSSSSDWFSSG